MAPQSLVIVESPAKCSKIQGFLGQGYKVLASMGHIRALEEDLDAIGLERNFEPKYHFLKEKAKAITQLKDAASKADRIFLAADDDREGEMIAYSVCLLLKQDPKTCPRAVFHEITKQAVVSAIQNPRTLDMHKVDAAQARAVLDMLVGFTMSPLLWKAVAPALSAGRCQTPALRLVADKEEEIGKFTSTCSWKIHGEFQTKDGFGFSSHLDSELEDEESASNYLENHTSTPTATCLSADTKPWSESPPIPLITSTLQQQASTLFRSNPKATMKSAQRLYEAGHITYMRTDKAVLSEEAIANAKKIVEETYGKEYIGSGQQAQTATKKPRIKKATAIPEEVKAQEAHEAIRPTHFELATLPASEDWSAVDKKIYNLIRLRALQSVMASAKGEQRSAQMLLEGDEKDDGFLWRASWRRTTFPGWRICEMKAVDEDQPEEADSEASSWQKALGVTPGTKVTWAILKAEPHYTKAPQRYTEATLIRDLEQKGIGRPSTFAQLISTIQEKGYVETKSFEGKQVAVKNYTLTRVNQWPPNIVESTRPQGAEKDRLTPTALGLSVLKFLLAHFSDLFDYGFTATMESRLDTIAKGEEGWKNVVRDTWNSYKERYQTLKSATPSVGGGSDRRKELGEGLVAILTKKGPLLLKESADGDKEKTVFYGWPAQSILVDAMTLSVAKEFIAKEAKKREGEELGLYEDAPVVVKAGPYGKYVIWKEIRVPYTEGMTLETVVEKIEEKKETSAQGRIIGAFEIRKGPYGLYMFKHALQGPARKFVSVPETLPLDTVTEATLVQVYQAGLQAKARGGAYGAKRGGGGGRGGRGGRGFRGGKR